MNISCDIIKDLLPLYHDDVCSEDSRKLVEEHLDQCGSCSAELKKYDGEILFVNNLRESRSMEQVARKWKADKKMAFLRGAALVSLIGCILCIVLYRANGSYVDENGFLVESFGFIPLAYLFGLIAVVSSVILAVNAARKRLKKGLK